MTDALTTPRAATIPDKPSIAVLPLANLSDDPQQEYFSDGMTEDLITALSKISGMFVIARTSVFTYKGKPVKVQQVSQELGVRYVLEGSVRKVAERVRITAQLIDASTVEPVPVGPALPCDLLLLTGTAAIPLFPSGPTDPLCFFQRRDVPEEHDVEYVVRAEPGAHEPQPWAVLNMRADLAGPLARAQLLALPGEVEQAGAALENGDVAVGQERDLSERLLREMFGAAIFERDAAHVIVQAGLLERPAQPHVAHEAARAFGHPVVGPDSQRHDPCILFIVAAHETLEWAIHRRLNSPRSNPQSYRVCLWRIAAASPRSVVLASPSDGLRSGAVNPPTNVLNDCTPRSLP